MEAAAGHYNRRMNTRKNHKPVRSFVARLLAIVILGCPAVLCGAANPNPSDMVIWYRQPAAAWLQAMPLGNGMIGAMVFGGVPQERMALKKAMVKVHKEMESRIGKEMIESVYKETGFDPAKL